MKKYNLSKIMKRAWALVKKSAMTMSIALKEAWMEAKRIRESVTFNVCGKETFSVNAKTGVVTGKTYNSRQWLKDNLGATWNNDSRCWTVDIKKFNTELDTCAAWYAKYIVDETFAKVIVSEKLVNRNDGFYNHIVYADGSDALHFVG